MADQPQEIAVLDKYKNLRPPSKRVRIIQGTGIFFVLAFVAFLYSPLSNLLVVVPIKTMPPLLREANSEELQQRLYQQFPPGTNEAMIIRALAEQGFSSMVSSKDDKTIHTSYFESQFGVLSGIRSTVQWKVDKDDKIIWTKGFVFHEAP